jgi:hypothetical protein
MVVVVVVVKAAVPTIKLHHRQTLPSILAASDAEASRRMPSGKGIAVDLNHGSCRQRQYYLHEQLTATRQHWPRMRSSDDRVKEGLM